ncbi:MAG: arginyltransferase [Rhodospirillaceae bacterium]|nr:arginyltransferase [Rhodospirillaceae bacterium]MBT7292958.1 arginyltransferase [Rhodospirillaceae bacterium]
MTFPKPVTRDPGEDKKRQSLATDRLDFLFATRPQPCPYLPANRERKIVAELADGDAARRYEPLIRAGYRRSGAIAYRHACPACRACVPVRINIADFKPGKSLRRVRGQNSDLAVTILPALARPDHFDLFRRYQEGRHGDGEMADMDYEDYRTLVEESFVSTKLAEFRTPDDSLMAVCLYDSLGDSLSAVYTFFEPCADKRSLGSEMILWLAKNCRETNKKYLYLGFWIEESAKMAYKARFRPLQMLVAGTWRQMP